MIKGLKQNKTYLTYSLYNSKQELVTTKSILLSRKANGVTIDNANTDGYLKVAVIGSRAIAIPGEMNVDITEPTPQEYSSNIVITMSLDASGDCMYDGDDGGKTCEEKYNEGIQGCHENYQSEISSCTGASYNIATILCKSYAIINEDLCKSIQWGIRNACIERSKPKPPVVVLSKTNII